MWFPDARRVVAVGLLACSAGCQHGAPASTPVASAPTPAPTPTTVVRSSESSELPQTLARIDSTRSVGVTQVWVDQAPDAARRARGVGLLQLTVRSLRAPTQTLEASRVGIYDERGTKLREAVAGAGGVVEPLELPSGEYVVHATQLGYQRGVVRLPVDAGCTGTAELFLMNDVMGLETAVILPSSGYRRHWWQLWRPKVDWVDWRAVEAEKRRTTPTSRTIIMRASSTRATVTRCRPVR